MSGKLVPCSSPCGRVLIHSTIEGVEFTDIINMGVAGLGLTVRGQSIGVAAEWGGFEGVDGVLGYVSERLWSPGVLVICAEKSCSLGPTGLTIGTLNPDTTTSIPTGE